MGQPLDSVKILPVSRIRVPGGVVPDVMPLQTRWRSEEFYERNAKALVSFAASIVGAADAEDVVATVAGRLFSSQAFDTADNQQAFMYQAVLNEARSHLRSSRRRRWRETRAARDRGLWWDRGNPDRHSGPDLDHLLETLSPRQRAVVHLTYWEELTGPEVAERLDISEGSVRKHLARAKDALRSAIEQQTDTTNRRNHDG